MFYIFFLVHHFLFAGGIFLLLGYSSIDEELLRAYTNLGIHDTVRAFQQYIYNHIDNQVGYGYSIVSYHNENINAFILGTVFSFLTKSSCILSALNLTDENAIISVRLQNYSNATPMEAFNALKVNQNFDAFMLHIYHIEKEK